MQRLEMESRTKTALPALVGGSLLKWAITALLLSIIQGLAWFHENSPAELEEIPDLPRIQLFCLYFSWKSKTEFAIVHCKKTPTLFWQLMQKVQKYGSVAFLASFCTCRRHESTALPRSWTQQVLEQWLKARAAATLEHVVTFHQSCACAKSQNTWISWHSQKMTNLPIQELLEVRIFPFFLFSQGIFFHLLPKRW